MSACHLIEKRPPEVTYEVLAGVERVPQPSPGYAPGGDCFACSSYAILRHCARAKGVELPFSLEDLYRKVWAHKDIGAERGSSFYSMERFWWQWSGLLGWHGLPLDHVQDPAITIGHAAIPFAFGPRLYQTQVLARRLRTYLEAGYVAHVEMQYEAQRQRWKRGEGLLGADHVVVIDGYRELTERDLTCSGEGYGAHWGGSTDTEVHVVCSARGAYWIGLRDWVEDHGGFNVWFVRPRRAREIPWPDAKPCPEGHRAKDAS